MTTINLKDYYPWYTHDEFVEVSEEVAEELNAEKRYQRTHERIQRRYNVHSLDAMDGTEASAVGFSANSPDDVLDMKERHCRLCQALNSLPEIQGRRIEAHYLLGKTQEEIAEGEGVSNVAVHLSITKGLAAMKIHYGKNLGLNFCPKSVLIYERNFSLLNTGAGDERAGE